MRPISYYEARRAESGFVLEREGKVFVSARDIPALVDRIKLCLIDGYLRDGGIYTGVPADSCKDRCEAGNLTHDEVSQFWRLLYRNN